jgi:hypothetical protein
MNKLADAMKLVRDLPEDRQDLAAEILLNLVSGDAFPIGLNDEQLAEIELAKREADSGDFATDAEVEAVWKKHRG